MSHSVACPHCGWGIPTGSEEAQKAVCAAITSERALIEMAKKESAKREAANSELLAWNGHREMLLRDHFAALAMQASRARFSEYATWADLATDAYGLADAMLKERAK